MTTRRFEMVEGASSKFWEVRQDGASFTVTYGRIGTAGTSKTTPCDSPEAAAQEVAALVREKLKKGYQEIGAATENWRPPAHHPAHSHLTRFLNYAVTRFEPDGEGEEDESRRSALPQLRDLDRRVFFVGVTYDDADATFTERLTALLDDPKVGDLRALLIGPWTAEYDEDGPGHVATLLREHAHKLRALKGLFLGDIVQEENEISWIHQTDWGATLSALPALEHVVIRGGEGLRLTGLRHPNLRSLTIQTGGLGRETVGDVLGASLPELRALTLWLGDDNYGNDLTMADLAPLLSGGLFPKLEHLGLQDAPNQDEIAVAVAGTPLVGRLKGLDLSMGTLSDLGGQALLASPAVRGLKWLNLRYNFLSAGMAKQLAALGPEVNVADRQEEDPDDRYIEVSE